MRALHVVLWWLALASVASAHDRSLSTSRWELDGSGAHVQLTVRALDLSALQAAGVVGALQLSEPLRDYLQQHLSLHSDQGPCSPVADSYRARRQPGGFAHFDWRVMCPGPARRVRSTLLHERPGHLHWVAVGGASGLLSEHNPGLRWGTGDAWSTAQWVRSGAEHVWMGWDHLLFLLGLLLVTRTWRQRLSVVTGFTCGHAITLLATALGWVDVQSAAVEWWIGLTILLVGCEAALPRVDSSVSASVAAGIAVLGVFAGLWGAPLSPLVWIGSAVLAYAYLQLMPGSEASFAVRGTLSASFGLVHGFGFAGAFGELPVQGSQRVWAVLGFNLGVELGQLVALGVALACAALAVRLAPRVRLQAPLALGLAAAGAFVVVLRGF